MNGLSSKNRIQKDENTVKISTYSSEPHLSEYEFMTTGEISDQWDAVKKRIRSERGWCRQDNYNLRQLEYEIIQELSGEFPVSVLCESMSIQRSTYILEETPF